MSDQQDGRHYTIGDVAALYDLPASTLRWWEKQGVLPAPARTSAQRVYDEQALSRIGLAYLCCVIGRMPLAAAAVITSGRPGNDEWQRTLADQIDHIEQQITRLQHARTHLDRLRRCPDDDPVTQCPYLVEDILEHTPRGRAAPHGPATRRPRSSGPTVPGDGTLCGSAGSRCRQCGAALPEVSRGRKREYCSPRCRQRACRQRAARK